MKKVYYWFFILAAAYSSAFGYDARPTLKEAYHDANDGLDALVMESIPNIYGVYVSYYSMPTIKPSSIAEISPEFVGNKFIVKGTTDEGMPFLTVKLEKRDKNSQSKHPQLLGLKDIGASDAEFCTATIIPEVIQYVKEPNSPIFGYFIYTGKYKVVFNTKCNLETGEAEKLLSDRDYSLINRLKRFVVNYVDFYVFKDIKWIEGVATDNYFWFPYIPIGKTEL